YSVGPRLKRSLLFSRLCIACGPSLAFAGGWALRASHATLPPYVLLLFVGQSVHTLLKDVPDAVGDARDGVRTLFTGVRPERLGILLPVLWTLPYVLASVGVALGWWPTRVLVLWVLAPVALVISVSPLQARGQDERELVRELAQIFSTAYVVLTLLTFAPEPVVVVVCAASVVVYLGVLACGIDRRGQSHRLATVAGFAVSLIVSRFVGEGSARALR